MKEIAKTLGKKDWDFKKDPCSGENNWKSSVQVKGFENAVTCNCSFTNATVCHIVSMYVIFLLSICVSILYVFGASIMIFLHCALLIL